MIAGYLLDELKNDITRENPRVAPEPGIDYVATKIPRFAFEKFPQAGAWARPPFTLTTRLKSVGEAMATVPTFKESLQKCLRPLGPGGGGTSPPRHDGRAAEASPGGRWYGFPWRPRRGFARLGGGANPGVTEAHLGGRLARVVGPAGGPVCMNAFVTITQKQVAEFLLNVAVVRPVFLWGPPGIG